MWGYGGGEWDFREGLNLPGCIITTRVFFFAATSLNLSTTFCGIMVPSLPVSSIRSRHNPRIRSHAASYAGSHAGCARPNELASLSGGGGGVVRGVSHLILISNTRSPQQLPQVDR